MALHLGVDWGSCGLRSAYCQGDSADDLALAPSHRLAGRCLLCEPAPDSPLGMRFSSVKGKLGDATPSASQGEGQSPAEVSAGWLRLLRETAMRKTGATAESVVLTTPARYSAARRAALRNVAMQAGFQNVAFLSDSMAVALAHRRSPAPTTLLVYSMGYEGFELGLFRATRGHLRALAYEGGDEPGGATFDRQILLGLVACLHQADYDLETTGWTTANWLGLQRQIQEVKERLSRWPDAQLPLLRPDRSSWLAMQFTRAAYLAATGGQIAGTINRAKRLLADVGLEPRELDEIIISGGSTGDPGVAEALGHWLGRLPVAAEPFALARGAAWYAAGLTPFGGPLVASDKDSLAVAPVEPPATTPAVRGAWADLPAKSADLVPVAGAMPSAVAEGLVLRVRSPDEVPAGVDEALRHPRELQRQGDIVQARAWLEAVVRQAQALLQSLTMQTEQPGAVPLAARRALARASRLLKEGRLEEGVRASHSAWQLAPQHPGVFDQMIEIHRQAAARFQDPANYEAAQRWLGCAYQHDQSNSTIRHMIADRHFLHAQQMLRRARPEEAAVALDLCLHWDPGHSEANCLKQSGLASGSHT